MMVGIILLGMCAGLFAGLSTWLLFGAGWLLSLAVFILAANLAVCAIAVLVTLRDDRKSRRRRQGDVPGAAISRWEQRRPSRSGSE
jgi:membrane protein implicated in regulation of membrane protease activity